jgi:sterol desaturase/sphingolipid hydroxylase (fatty acid hydroxylase superfamily)/rhodanese-related sulfurtransferase
MVDLILANEPLIRMACFGAIILTIGVWEAAAPCRTRAFSRWQRWPNNLGIVVFNSVIARFAFPVAAVGTAAIAQQNGWGLLNTTDLPPLVAIVLAVIILDFVVYLQHMMFHAVPALWRLHRMHHTDLDFDVTTGARFHPIEIVLSMGLKLVVVSALGAPPVAVLIFEVLLNGTSMFNHGNIHIAPAIDRVLRWIVVTPDMHRIHHSDLPHETNSNFGFSLPWWDRLCGTYRDQPERGHRGMTIGIGQFRDGRELWLDRLLVQPFRGDIGPYALGHKPEQWIDVPELQAKLAQNSDEVLIDVRGPDEYVGELGHIPGARNIPLDELPNRINDLATEQAKSITMICKTDKRSAAAAELMRQQNFSDVRVLKGGMEAWIRHDLPVDRQ